MSILPPKDYSLAKELIFCQKYNFRNEDFENSYKFSKEVISLPIYPKLKSKELNYITEVINTLWKKFKK